MKLIIVQGMSCLGKSTLCKYLQDKMLNSIYLSIDKYKENIWDKFGFNTVERREELSSIAKNIFICDLINYINNKKYNYVIIDYVFQGKFWNDILSVLKYKDISISTIYLKPKNMDEHREAWEKRSRDFTVKHPGHGATTYNNLDGTGTLYVNNFDDKINIGELPTLGNIMTVDVKFKPEYKLSKSKDTILNFATAQL